jgi:hypothetical protein
LAQKPAMAKKSVLAGYDRYPVQSNFLIGAGVGFALNPLTGSKSSLKKYPVVVKSKLYYDRSVNMLAVWRFFKKGCHAGA